MEKLQLKTKDLTQENIAKLIKLFPEIITEIEKDGKTIKTINADKLKELVGDYADNNSEVYELTWAGKQKSRQKIVMPINKTLRPVPNDSVDFETTENLYVEGDNFEVLKLLQESYLNKVKMIYIDPPYNTGKDFVYKDNFTKSKDEEDKDSGTVDDEGNKLFKNTTTNGRFHSDWLSMMFERLVIAKDLLRDDGVIFISIDDNEVDNLRKICDEVFGEDKHVNTIAIKMSESTGLKMAHVDKKLPKLKEYLLVYKKTDLKLNTITIPKGKWDSEYKYLIEGVSKEELDFVKNIMNKDNTSIEEIKKADEICSKIKTKNIKELFSETLITKEEDKLKIKYNNAWRIMRDVATTGGAKKIADTKREETQSNFFLIITPQNKKYLIKKDYNLSSNQPRIKMLFADEYLSFNPGDFWQDIKTTGLDNEGGIPYKNGKKPLKLIERAILLSTNSDSIILDFFSGSSSSAEAILNVNLIDGGNRKYIMVQLDENLDESLKIAESDSKKQIKESIDFLDSINKPHILTEIGKERIRRATKKIKEDNKDKDLSNVDFGFRVFKADSSNMKDVYYNPNQINQTTLTNLKDNIKEDRTDKDLLYQVLLELAIPLSAKVEEQTLNNKTIYKVNDTFLIACFDDNIDLETIKQIAELNPLRIVFKDSSFKDDSTKVNCDEYLKNKLPNTIVKVI